MASLSRLPLRSRSLFTCTFHTISRKVTTERTTNLSRKPKPKNMNFSRKPVSFNMAEHIHAEMTIRHKNPVSVKNDALFCASNSEVPDAEDGDDIKSCEELKIALWQKPIEGVEMSLLPDIGRITLEKSLDIADIFFARRYRQEKFLMVLLENVEQKHFQTISPSEITRLMFYVFLHGSAPHKLFFKLEEYLCDNLDSFEVNDIGVVCLGYFRGMKRIVSHDLLDKIGRRVLDDLDQLRENSLINILKTLRHSGFARISFFEDLSEKLFNSSYISETTNLNVLMHIAVAFASSSMHCKDLNSALLKRFVHLVDRHDWSRKLRSKDIAKFVWAMGTVVHGKEEERDSYVKLADVYEKLCQQQDQLHPESLADLLQGMIYLQIHPEHLITRLVQPSTANMLKDHTVYSKAFQLLLINNSVIIECPSYTGKLLSESFQQSLQRVPGMTGDLDFELQTRQGLQEVLTSLREMFGLQKVRCHFLLPHFTLADIEMRLDSDRKPLEFTAASAVPVVSPPGGRIQATVTDDLLSALSPQHRAKADLCKYRVTVQVMGQNQCFSNSVDEMKGNYATKLRQLRVLGYRILLISPQEARELVSMAENTRRKFLIKRFLDLGLDMLTPEDDKVQSENNTIK